MDFVILFASTSWSYISDDTFPLLLQVMFWAVPKRQALLPWQLRRSREKKYSELAKDNYFIPIAQETFGSWGPAGLELLKEIGTRTIIASGNKRARANLFQNISMAMIRGNIINVKNTLPPHNKNQEFLFLN